MESDAIKAWNRQRVLPPSIRSASGLTRRLLLGSPLKSHQAHEEQLGVWSGLVVLAVDALSSVAYATEEILLALMVAGSSALNLSLGVGIAIALLIAIVVMSYTQTVQAFPHGGGAYTVSKSQLGGFWPLVAASALLIDYILTVSVSVAAGVRAIASAIPSLVPDQVLYSLCIIIGLSWINLRGLRESAYALALPVLIYILAIGVLGLSGMEWIFTHDSPVIENSHTSTLFDIAIVLVLLRAFAGGCTALTGIEAVANAGNMLEKPHDKVAARILMLLGGLLLFLFLSITWTTHAMQVLPSPHETLISILARSLYGEGVLYTLTMGITAVVLFLAANTAFAGFPKLCSLLAIDGWMPKQFAAIGDKLVFSNGILSLALASSVLIVMFNSNPHLLIPLYAIGVFMAFTLSQWGMVRYWRNKVHTEEKTGRVRYLPPPAKAILNGTGAIATGLALIITFEAKFKEGAYLIMLAMPILMGIFYTIHRHYQRADGALMQGPNEDITGRTFSYSDHQAMIVPISRLHKGAVQALAFAREMSKDVTAVVVDIEHRKAKKTKEAIENLRWDIKVEVLPSPYRSIVDPIVMYVHTIDQARQDLAVLVLPELILVRWWQRFLHNNTAIAISNALMWSDPLPGRARVIINVPYYLKV